MQFLNNGMIDNPYKSLVIVFDKKNQDFFFLSGFSVPNIHDSQDSRGKERVSIFNSSLSLPPASQTLRH